MDTNNLQQYLTKVSREMLMNFGKRLDVPINFPYPEVELRPMLTNAGLSSLKEGGYKIYIQSPERNIELEEKVIASSELGLVHEVGHMLHMEANPRLKETYNRETELVESFLPGRCTPLWHRIFHLGETAAEYLGLQFIDERQGLNAFFKRHQKESKTGVYWGVLRSLRKIEGERRMDVAKILVKSDYEEVRRVPELEEYIFSATENYIAKHPEIFNPPYQLSLTGMRHLIR
ncbi:MAG: hypothetical protein WCK29_01905 [archaeon]